MKRLILFTMMLCLLNYNFYYAKAGVIYSPSMTLDDEGNLIDTKQENTEKVNPGDFALSPEVQQKPKINYPKLIKKNNDYYCFTTGEKELQLYGWQEVDEGDGTITWYCFDKSSGKMLKNTWTEDGYYVGEDGKINTLLNNARDYGSDGFKFLTSSKEFTYLFSDRTTPSGTWVAISPLKDGQYYWYYFDYNGKLAMNSSSVQNKYRVNDKGQYVNEKGVVVSFFIGDGDKIDETTRPDFTDSTGLTQNSIIYTGKDVVGIQGFDNQVIYAAGYSKMQNFMRYVSSANAVNCDFDIQDRTFYDEPAEDHKGILKSTIMMNGNKSSFKLDTSKWNTITMQFAVEWDGGKIPKSEEGVDDDEYAYLDVYEDGELIYNIDGLWRDKNVVELQEFVSEKRRPLTFTFNSSSSNINLILTVTRMKNDKELDEG